MTVHSAGLGETSNSWFSTQVEYRGMAQAQFYDPPGLVRCSAEVTADEAGDCLFTMLVRREDINCSEDLPFGVAQFVSGERPVRVGDRTCLEMVSFPRNPCKSLQLETEEGSLSVVRISLLQNRYITGFEPEDAVGLEFHVTDMRFVSRDAKQAKYFVIPLLNFISDFRLSDGASPTHPLRVTPVPGPSPSSSDADPGSAWQETDARGRPIVFEFSNSTAFIEPLRDYDAKRDSIEHGRVKVGLTAVLVGELGGDNAYSGDLRKWKPTRLLELLSFATGSFVGAPWVEFRDADGGLVARHHACLGRRASEEGHRVIEETKDWGTAHLLTTGAKALVSRDFDATMAMIYAVKSGSVRTASVEDKLRAVENALECLFKQCRITGENLLSPLSEQTAAAVREAVRTAADKINELANSLKSTADSPAGNIAQWRKLLQRVAGRISRVPEASGRDFGLLVTKLLSKYDLPDASIADKCYETLQPQPNSSVRPWRDMVSKYRNKAAHTGYFEFLEGTYDLLQVRAVADHLHDIVIRVILKEMGYLGTYQTPLLTRPSSVRVGWITELTLRNALGRYKRFSKGLSSMTGG